MTILHLGVVELPYAWTGDRGKSGSGAKKVSTTGDVAEILEDKYHVMQIFFEQHTADIAKALEEAIAGQLETLLMAGPREQARMMFRGNATKAAMAEIQILFEKFITNQEMDQLGYPGVPTAAALRGVNHRMKHPYAKREPRPSFRDTGLYLSAFKAWMDEQSS